MKLSYDKLLSRFAVEFKLRPYTWVAAKKTGVSATPGKTKHFQTLELGDGLMLADCPGLVFPSFTAGASTPPLFGST